MIPYDKPGDKLAVSRRGYFRRNRRPWCRSMNRSIHRHGVLTKFDGVRIVSSVLFSTTNAAISGAIDCDRCSHQNDEGARRREEDLHRLCAQDVPSVSRCNQRTFMDERTRWLVSSLSVRSHHSALKNQITRGMWLVREVEHVDLEKRQIWFAAGGRIQVMIPTSYTFVTSISAAKSGSSNTRRWDASMGFFSESRLYRRSLLANRFTARRRSTWMCGWSPHGEVYRASADELLQAGWKMPQPFVARGEWHYDIHGMIVRPAILIQLGNTQ